MTFTPTEQQRAIFASALQGHNQIIEARAGCGKTSTLVKIVEELAAQRPRTQLLLAFNTKIKDELDYRLLGKSKSRGINPDRPQAVPGVTIKTLNGLGHSAWAKGRKLTLNEDNKTFDLIKQVCEQNATSVSFAEKLGIKALVGAAKIHGLVPKGQPGVGLIQDDEASWDFLWDWSECESKDKVGQLIIAKQVLIASIESAFKGLIDFADQLYMPTLFGGQFNRYDLVLGDESQDFAPLNHKMLKLIPANQKIYVGDPMQSIYAFRGALHNSMEELTETFKNKAPVDHLKLTTTFRCGKAIVQRAKQYVPDFEAGTQNPDGKVVSWPLYNHPRPEGETSKWSLHSVPDGAAVLCRNNAPLVKLALKCLSQHRKVTILGRDFANQLKRDINKAEPNSDAPGGQLLDRLAEHYASKLKSSATDSQRQAIEDKVNAVEAMIKGISGVVTKQKVLEVLDSIFSDRPDNQGLLLSTGHKAKGLEWDWVMHLNPYLIPSRFAQTEEDLVQEYNLKYVIETRPKFTLVLANLEDMES